MRYLLLLLFLAVPLQAQEVSAYKIKSLTNCAQRSGCTEQIGTGALVKIVDGYGWFITAGHVLGSQPSVELGNHFYNVSVIQSWNSPGMAPDKITLIRTTEPVPSSNGKGYATHYLTKRKPKTGDKVWLIGYPYGKYKYVSTIITEVNDVKFLTRKYLDIGASGGLVVFQDDQALAGIIHAYTGDTREGINTRGDYIHYKMRDQFANLLQRTKKDKAIVKNKPGFGVPEETPEETPEAAVVAGMSAEDLEAKMKEWSIERDITLAETLETIIADNNLQHEERSKELQSVKEESSKQYGELKGLLTTINGQFVNNFKKQEEKLENIKLENKTFQEEFREQIENPKSIFGDDTEDSEVPVAPEVPEVPEVSVVPVVPEVQTEEVAGSDLFSYIGASILGIPWLAILGGLGVAIPGGAAGYLALKGLNSFMSRRRRHKPEVEGGQTVDYEPANLFPRDVSEAKQILDLRQSEQREPIYDAMRGIFLEDEFNSNPDQLLKDAYASINSRFNNTVPVSTKHKTVSAGTI